MIIDRFILKTYRFLTLYSGLTKVDPIPVWLQDSDELTKDHPHRIYASNKKATNEAMIKMSEHKGKDGYGAVDHGTSVQKTADSRRSQELIPESESEDEGWMMSKRRRVVTNSAHKTSYIVIILVMPFVRWLWSTHSQSYH